MDTRDSPSAGRPRAGRRGFLVLALLVGVLAGIGSFTLLYAEGLSYLSSDSSACANCHIMWPQYDGWQKSSHHAVAGCVDCHLPQGFVRKYLAKATNGWHHSVAFTFQNFHEPIRITAGNAAILEENCLRCHAALVDELVLASGHRDDPQLRCTTCHATVGHGDAVGLGGPERGREAVIAARTGGEARGAR